MSKKLFGKFFIFLLVVGLLFAVLPKVQVMADWATFDGPDYYYVDITSAPSGTFYRQAGFSPDGTKIVAQKTTGASTEIVLMNADGSNEIVVSPGDSESSADIYGYMNPFWSDDGTSIGFAQVFETTVNNIMIYDIATSNRSYIYEPTSPLDPSNPDFLGSSKTAIVFWAAGVGGGADLFTWDGSVLVNITNSSEYYEYEPISNANGTKILYWSGETTAEPVNTTHTLTFNGTSWLKDSGFTPIVDSYWSYWSTPTADEIALTVMSTKDIHIYNGSGTFLKDLSGSTYSGGSGQWNFFGSMPKGPNGEYAITSNAGRGAIAGRDIVIANPRAVLYVSATGSDSNPGTPAAPFATIQKAVNEVAVGGTVHVANGTYVESPNIYKSLSLIGESEAGVIIDATAIGGYSMEVFGDITTTLKNFTLKGNPTTAGSYGLKVAGDLAFTTIDRVTVTDSYGSGIDLNGLNGTAVSNVTIRDTRHGAGLALTDCSNVAVSNVTTSGNAWGGMAVFTGNTTPYTHGSDGISLSGTNSFGESNKLYIETVPGYQVTNFTQDTFLYTVKNSDLPLYTFFAIDLDGAKAFALALPTPLHSSIEKIADGSHYVFPGMSIQTAIVAATAGDTINVAAGTYPEQVNINKRVSIIGSGKDGSNATIITSNALGTVLLGATGTIDSPILIKDLQITGAWGIRTSITPIDYFTMDNVWLNANPVKSGEGFRLIIGHQMTHLTIKNSIIEGYIDGVIIEKTPGTGDSGTKLQYVTVTDTIFRNNYRKGLYTETLSDAVFTNVQLLNNGYVNPGTSLAEFNSAGFDINLKDGTYSDLQFINMTATGNGLKAKDGAALMIKARDDGATYSLNPASLTGVVISGGSFTGNERGIRFGEPGKTNAGPTGVVISGAALFGNVKTYDGSDGSAYGDVVNFSLAKVDATENWWGLASGPAAGQIYGDVQFCGWLNAAPPDGVPVAYPVTNTTTLEGFCTIQAAIDDADTEDGDTITVAAGTYVEDLVIDKSVTLLGPNATINPNTGTRGAEAILLPAFSAPDPAVCEVMTYIEVSGVTIKGFTFDGDNPALTSGVMIGTADVDACEIIASYEGVGNIVIENNILKNSTYTGIDLYNYYDNAATAGNYIRYNLIQDMGETTYNWGVGVLVYNNFYADITDNVFDNVRTGIQTGNYYRANVGTTGSISNNVINAWRGGIFHNLWYSAASPITVSNNTITAVAHAGVTRWNGMLVSSFDGAANATISGNIITIPDTVSFDAPGYAAGYNIWNDHTTAPLVISGGSVTGGDYGVFVNNYEGYDNTALNTSVTINGVTISGSDIGVYVKDNPLNIKNATVTAIIKNNVITATTGIKVEGADATASGDHNQVYATTDVENTNTVSMNFENNYWDSPCGATVIGLVDTIPWYADAGMTILRSDNVSGNVTFVPTMSTLEMNSLIACAAPYTTFTFTKTDILFEYPGGIIIPTDRHHLKFILNDGVKIKATSPCFDVRADFTTIEADNISMAACVTAADSNGIDVADGIRNLTVDGLEIYGPGNDGIHFAGVIRDVVLKDNYIHDLVRHGVFFGAQPVVVDPVTNPDGIDIHGNLFENNGGNGIEAGTFTVPAEFNSWGNVAGAAAGDGASVGVDADPFTHVDVYMVASGTPWTGIPLNQVVSGQPITFKVKAHVVNALTVDVKLAFPTNLTGAVTSAATSAFPEFAVFDTGTANVIGFYGMAPYVLGLTPETTGYLPITGDVELFTVTFTGGTPGLALPMNLDELSDVFGMEGHGSSTNIYAAALLDSTVNVINLPVIDIVPVPGQTYIAGLPIEFNVVITNLNGANYADIGLEFETGGSDYVEFLDTDNVWKPYPGVISWGALATNGTDLTPVLPLFRVTFSDPGVNTINLTMLDRPAVDDIWLDDTFEDFTLLGNFTVTGTFSMQGRSTRAGIPVTLDYQDMVAYADKTGTTINQISYNLVIPGVNGGGWMLTTLQPRYLNVIIANNKIVSVDGNETLIALQLKGGNAVWTDNVINVTDASEVGTYYGTGTIADNADVNFDGKVNIQDLALVGGNFDLTSETAYGIGKGSIWTVQ